MILLPTVIIIAVLSQAAHAQTCNGIPDVECQALYALYISTAGDNWILKQNWLSDKPVNDWDGITVENGHVTVINFSYYPNNLDGTLPPEIGNLTELRNLSLPGNRLRGTIPPELGNLINLEELNFGGDFFTGSIPLEMANLVNLKSLGLAGNRLSGEILPELENLTKLEVLSLNSNQFTGVIPAGLGSLENLRYLSLNDNSLSSSIPRELGNLTALESLRIQNCNLTGSIPPELGNLINLNELNLFQNNLTGVIPAELGNLTSLEELCLSNNSLSGNIPPELGNLTQLTELNLNLNNLAGPIPPEFGNLSNLQEMYMSSNDINGDIPPELGNLANLRGLYLHENSISGVIPANLGNMSSLQYLWLFDNNLSGTIPPELGNLGDLRWLSLNSNNLAGPIPPELGNPPYLNGLILDCNQLSGEIPEFLASFPTFLDLRYNSLYSTDPDVSAGVEEKHDGEFMSTQTLAPDNIRAEPITAGGNIENSVLVSWDPIAYQEDDGGYQVYYKKTTDPEYKYYGITADKKATSLPVFCLAPGDDYTFKAKTVTWSHVVEKQDAQYQQEDLFSPLSESASATAGTYSRAFIPAWKQSPDYWTGVVALNFSNTPFTLDLTAYDSSGNPEALGINPVSSNIGARHQISLLGNEFFQSDPSSNRLSWIELGALQTYKMGSIFLFGNNDTEMMDGAEAQGTYSQKIYFTRPLQEGIFAGWEPDIQMSLVNPTDDTVTVRCTLKGSNGELSRTHIIPAHGFLSGDAVDLIASFHGIVNAYLEVEVTDGIGVTGFSRIELPGANTALGMSAMEITGSKTYYSAQAANGPNIVTDIRLVNTASSSRHVTIHVRGDDGTPLADPATVEIQSNGVFNSDLETIFSLENQVALITGSLVIEADGHGIIGDIIFAEGNTMEYAISQPLQDQLFTEAVFNHISNLPTVFTGFAFFNPGDSPAGINIEAIGIEGQEIAGKALVLGPGERMSRIMTDPDMWPDFPFQSGGYIKIQSSQPIAGLQLFGDRSLRYMAAVPPTTRLEGLFN